MKYTITFSCGHTETIDLYGSSAERERKVAYFEEKGICSACYKKEFEEQKSRGCDEVEMKYSDYKNNYSDCKTKYDSYNAATKTIVVYIPRIDETVANAEKEAVEAVEKMQGRKLNEIEIRNIKENLKQPIEIFEKAVENAKSKEQKEIGQKILEIVRNYKNAVEK